MAKRAALNLMKNSKFDRAIEHFPFFQIDQNGNLSDTPNPHPPYFFVPPCPPMPVSAMAEKINEKGVAAEEPCCFLMPLRSGIRDLFLVSLLTRPLKKDPLR